MDEPQYQVCVRLKASGRYRANESRRRQLLAIDLACERGRGGVGWPFMADRSLTTGL